MEPPCIPRKGEGRLLLVDGHAYAYRAFHAIRRLSSPTGAPTNALYGFIKMLARMQLLLQPTHLLVVWDGGLCPERITELPGYKAQRPPMPADLAPQIEAINVYLQAANIAAACQPGVEADDWIATVARHGTEADISVVIASSDKDFMQLVSPQVGLFNPNDKSEKIRGTEDVVTKTGVRPGQIVDWLSLIGDGVDNIAGVPGVGAKTATEWLCHFHSVDGLLARVAEVRPERLRANLESAAETVRRNQRLIRLKNDLSGHFVMEETAVRPCDAERLERLFAEWGFRSLFAQIAVAEPAQGALF